MLTARSGWARGRAGCVLGPSHLNSTSHLGAGRGPRESSISRLRTKARTPGFAIPAVCPGEGVRSGPGRRVCSCVVRGMALAPGQVYDVSPEGMQGPQAPLGASIEEQGPRGPWLRPGPGR